MYEVILPRRVRKSMSRFPRRDYDRVLQTIQDLAADPRPPGARKMRGTGSLEEWRTRVGNYRVVYRIDEPGETAEERSEGEVIVLDVGYRQEDLRMTEAVFFRPRGRYISGTI